jgi:hypothetical protein
MAKAAAEANAGAAPRPPVDVRAGLAATDAKINAATVQPGAKRVFY